MVKSFMERSARHFLTIKVTRELKKEIERAGLENLKILAEAGTSIVGTYLQGCSPSEKAQYRRDLNALLQMDITADMILTELARQMPEIAPIMEGKEGYKRGEVEKLEAFVREETK
ncbi:hypothetical protein ES708_05233 [subsurface metagenome]